MKEKKKRGVGSHQRIYKYYIWGVYALAKTLTPFLCKLSLLIIEERILSSRRRETIIQRNQ